MTRLEAHRRRQEADRERAKAASGGEQLARELNAIIRAAVYPDGDARRAAIERAKRRVGREWWPTLMGKVE